MTYSLFEFIKEKFDELIVEQPNEPEKLEVDKLCITDQEPQVLGFLCGLLFIFQSPALLSQI